VNSRDAYARLSKAGVPVIETAEAAALFGQSKFAASKTLARLAASGLVRRIRSGTYWIGDSLSADRVASYLTAPFQSYLSLHTALRAHGMIEQVPVVVYVVTLGRTRRLRTAAGTFSIHHIAPRVFGGFELSNGQNVATPEKALFDLAYLSGGRSRLRAALPELELPKPFRRSELERWLARIPSRRGRERVLHRLERILASARQSQRGGRRAASGG
jgi:predicted transcriptional regulator of viral defense system